MADDIVCWDGLGDASASIVALIVVFYVFYGFYIVTDVFLVLSLIHI